MQLALEIRQQLAAVLRTFPQIELAYLFGSAARGDMHANSDIDVAVFGSTALPIQAEAKLARQLAEAVPSHTVDLVLLRQATPLLRYEVISEGTLLHQGCTDDQLNQFEMRVQREFYDTEYLRRLTREYLREKS